MGNISKEMVLGRLRQGSAIQIVAKNDERHWDDVEAFAASIADAYDALHGVINWEGEGGKQVSDADFQSGLIFWSALNTLVAAFDLWRMGYSKEPQMLTRNVVEMFSAAYDLHVNPDKLDAFRQEKFDSRRSIKIAKFADPNIGRMYGQLSQSFSHVSLLHSMPHGGTSPLVLGGVYEGDGAAASLFAFSVPFIALDTLRSLMELSFYDYLPEKHYWRLAESNRLQYAPDEEIRATGIRIMKQMEEHLRQIGEERRKPDFKE